MRRFFIKPGAIADKLATLSEKESHHIRSVLRLESGTAVELFDGTGNIFQGTLEAVGKRNVTVRIHSQTRTEAYGQQLIVCQALLKMKKMDFLVQKTTEMGVAVFQPLLTRFCASRTCSDTQLERWQRIMLEACKQCGRSDPMTILPPVTPDEIDVADAAAKILFWEQEQRASLHADLLNNTDSICLVFGPEGGFAEDEITLLRESGFQSVSLGSNILRAETAALAGIAIVTFLSGGFRPTGTS